MSSAPSLARREVIPDLPAPVDKTDGRRCPRIGKATPQGNVQIDAVGEASGIAASRAQDGVFWIHNDSGGAARLYAVSLEGDHLGTFDVTGAVAWDWEDLDIGVGPKPRGRDYIYVGDIGDNLCRRTHVDIYRVEEPEIGTAVRPTIGRTGPAQRVRMAYPDQPHDAEALFVDPRDGSMIIVTKERTGPALVFRVGAESFQTGEAVAEAVATVVLRTMPVPGGQLVTAGTISSDGGWVLLRTYAAAFLWRRGPGTLADMFQEPGCSVPVALEPQGEAIAFTGSGLEYVSLSEGKNQPLYLFTELAVSGSTRP